MSLSTLLTDKEFAAFLKLAPKTGWQKVQKWARAGKLKGIALRVGDHWRFREDKIQVWIERGGMR